MTRKKTSVLHHMCFLLRNAFSGRWVDSKDVKSAKTESRLTSSVLLEDSGRKEPILPAPTFKRGLQCNASCTALGKANAFSSLLPPFSSAGTRRDVSPGGHCAFSWLCCATQQGDLLSQTGVACLRLFFIYKRCKAINTAVGKGFVFSFCLFQSIKMI